MSIEIVSKRLTDYGFWALDLAITQGAITYAWPVGVPDSVAEGDLQAYVEARESDYWRQASIKAKLADVLEDISPQELTKALALVVLDENNVIIDKINELCVIAGIQLLNNRSVAQLKNAIKAELIN